VISRRWIAAIVLLLLVAVPDAAHACSVCFDPREENRFAFLATTVFLSVLPLSLVGGVGLWLRKRARELSGLPDVDGEAGSPEA
jgi:hypothetical protein